MRAAPARNRAEVTNMSGISLVICLAGRDARAQTNYPWMSNSMLREIAFGGPAPRRCLAAIWLSLPLWIAAAPSSRASDWGATLRSIGQVVRGMSGKVGSLPAGAPPSADLGLPLPPYPPPIFGLDTPLSAGVGEGANAAASTKSAEPRAEALASPPLPAPAAGALAPDTLPEAPPSGGLVPPPLPAAAEDQAMQTMRAAFAKEVTGALFPRLAKPERLAILAYYEARGFKPLWQADGVRTAAA